jgi:proteasome lid subunit RPN8/RPN11
MTIDQVPDLPKVESLHTKELVTPQVEPETRPRLDIYLSMEAYQVIAAHADSDLSREAMGLLLGKVREKTGGLEVTIAQALKGQETLSTAASVQLSYESWKRFIKEKSANHPDLATVGWYHTHPGFGTFLSPMDELIHEHFFHKPWQVALVVDPVQGHWTFFQHQTDGIERCERFMLIVPDNSSPNGGRRWRATQPLPERRKAHRGLSGLFRSRRSRERPPLDDVARAERLVNLSLLGIDDCQRIISWSRIPLYVAIAGQRVCWMPSSQLLKIATSEHTAIERPLPHHIDAIAPSLDGKALYLLALDQSEIWVLHPDKSYQPLQSFQIESEESDDADISKYESDPLVDRCRLASLDNQRLIVATSGELVVLALNVEADVYQVAHRRKLPKKTYFSVLNPLRPLSLIKDVGVVVPDLLGDRLVCYDPLGEQDGHITVHDSPLDLPTDVVVAAQQLIILDSARERIVVSSQEGHLLREFRLSYDLKRQLTGLIGTNEATYLVLDDGVWRCDRLLDDRA